MLKNSRIIGLIFFLLIIGIFLCYKICQCQTIIGVVLKIQNDKFVCVKEDSNIEYYYSFNFENNKSNIKIGDVIKINYYDKERSLNFGYVNEIDKVKSVKIVGKDMEKVENTNYYNSIDNVSLLIKKFNSEGISFAIKDSNKKTYTYPDKYYIYKLGKNEVQKKNNISSEKTLIGYNKVNENVIEKTYDWGDMYGTLNERKLYVGIICRWMEF